MDLNTIELPDSVIAELYKNKLLITAKPATTQPLAAFPPEPAFPASSAPTAPSPTPAFPAPSAPTGYKILGNNQKKITILVDSPETTFLPDDQLAFLTKMLEACKLNIGDVAIVNQAAAPADIAGLKRQLSPAFLLLFGPGPAEIQLPIHFPLFKTQAYDQCSFLWVPSLAELVQPGEEGKLLKTKLWVCLKQLFEL